MHSDRKREGDLGPGQQGKERRSAVGATRGQHRCWDERKSQGVGWEGGNWPGHRWAGIDPASHCLSPAELVSGCVLGKGGSAGLTNLCAIASFGLYFCRNRGLKHRTDPKVVSTFSWKYSRKP